MDGLGPYRGTPSRPRFVCVACYRWTSPTPARCPYCEVELLDLAREDVRDDLRHELLRRTAEERDRRETGTVVLAAWAGLIAGMLAGIAAVAWWPSWILQALMMTVGGLSGAAATRAALRRLERRRDAQEGLVPIDQLEVLPLPGVLRRLGARRLP